MKSFLLINIPGQSNRGGMAVLIGMLEILRRQFGTDNIGVLCHHFDDDKMILDEILEKYDTTLIEHPWYKARKNRLITLMLCAIPAVLILLQSILIRYKIINKSKSIFGLYDVIIDCNVDGYSEYYQGWFAPFFILFNDFCATLTNKCVMIMGASIPFYKNRILRHIAKVTLNKMALITLRDEESKKHLVTMEVLKPHIEVTADLAFVMQPNMSKNIEEIFAKLDISNGILIGLNVTRANPTLASSSIYLSFMASMVDWAIDKLNCHVIMIPSVYDPAYLNDIDKIISKVKNTGRLILIHNKVLLADEIKAVIGKCDMFIGSMFHPCIAAVSTGVPTIPIATYGSYKFYGILGNVLKIEDYIVDFNGSDYAQLDVKLKATIINAWENRATLRHHLLDQAEKLKLKGYLNGTLLKEVIIC